MITTGDDSLLQVTLLKDNAKFLLNDGAIIRAAVISSDKSTVLIAPIPVLDSEVGSDWANSTVVIKFSSAATELITDYGNAIVEIEVADNGKLTWFFDIKIFKGSIT